MIETANQYLELGLGGSHQRNRERSLLRRPRCQKRWTQPSRHKKKFPPSLCCLKNKIFYLKQTSRTSLRVRTHWEIDNPWEAVSDGESRKIHQQSLRTWHPESEGHFCEEGRDEDSHRPGGLYSTSSLREVCTASEKDRLASYCANCRVYHLASEGRCPRAIEAKRKIA